jgi:2-hydroxychromene-2-carboxylate isomerase
MGSEIDYYYAAHSAFAYLGSAAFLDLAARLGRPIRHKPVDLRRVVSQASSAFSERSPAHYAYYFGREIERWSVMRNAPTIGHRPTYHDRDVDLANCLIIAGIAAGNNVDRLSHALLAAHWQDDADLSDSDQLTRIADAAGYDGAALLAGADNADVRAEYLANTEEALARPIFGSPTYILDGDMFYGQDHLEMMERAAKTPFPNSYRV